MEKEKSELITNVPKDLGESIKKKQEALNKKDAAEKKEIEDALAAKIQK